VQGKIGLDKLGPAGDEQQLGWGTLPGGCRLDPDRPDLRASSDRPRRSHGRAERRSVRASAGPKVSRSALVVVAAGGYADLVLGDFVDEAVLIGDAA
jgi:hypothetical protein